MIVETDGGRALSYLLILAIEEQLDHMNRATMRDERVHPTARHIAKLHVLEEARHVSFAKSFLAEVWPRLEEVDQATVQLAAAELVAEIVSIGLNPTVFDELAIADGYQTALANPEHQAHVIASLSKLTDFLSEVGVIDDEHRPGWVERGLVA